MTPTEIDAILQRHRQVKKRGILENDVQLWQYDYTGCTGCEEHRYPCTIVEFASEIQRLNRMVTSDPQLSAEYMHQARSVLSGVGIEGIFIDDVAMAAAQEITRLRDLAEHLQQELDRKDLYIPTVIDELVDASRLVLSRDDGVGRRRLTTALSAYDEVLLPRIEPHRCAVRDCGTQIPSSHALCDRHWFGLKSTQRRDALEVWAERYAFTNQASAYKLLIGRFILEIEEAEAHAGDVS